jgi:hypothetical protein
MIRTIQINAIPARRKPNRRSNPAWTRLLRQLHTVHRLIRTRSRIVTAKVLRIVAPKAYRIPLRHSTCLSLFRVASQHAETGLERRYLGTIVRRGIIHSHTSRLAIEVAIGDLWDAFVGSVTRFEKHVCGPVVGLVFGEGTCCASCEFGYIGAGDGRGEGVAADDLMDVWGRCHAGVDEPVGRFVGL